MTNNHTVDAGAIYRNILIDLPARGRGGRVEYWISKHSFDPLEFLSTKQSLVLSLVNFHWVVKDDFMPTLNVDILVNMTKLLLLILASFMILYSQLPNFITLFLWLHFQRSKTNPTNTVMAKNFHNSFILKVSLHNVCGWHMRDDIVLSLSGHHITRCPLLLSHSSFRRHVSHVWDRDQYCITDENSEPWNKSIDFPYILRDLLMLLLMSMLKVLKSCKYFDQRTTPNIYNFTLATYATENKESLTTRKSIVSSELL